MKRIPPPIGEKINKWTILGTGKSGSFWLCRCECGKEQEMLHNSIRYGQSTQCHGCARGTSKFFFLAQYGSECFAERKAYRNARERCILPHHSSFQDYGERGIEFRFKSIFELLDDIGVKPSKKHSLDRINNDGHYEIGNVKWSTRQEQIDNRRNTLKITYEGRTQSVSQWGRELRLEGNLLQNVRQQNCNGHNPTDALYRAILKLDRKTEYATAE